MLPQDVVVPHSYSVARTIRPRHEGATYRTLATIAHAAGMSKEQRVGWYGLCESIPLSQRHAGHIMGRIKREAA